MSFVCVCTQCGATLHANRLPSSMRDAATRSEEYDRPCYQETARPGWLDAGSVGSEIAAQGMGLHAKLAWQDRSTAGLRKRFPASLLPRCFRHELGAALQHAETGEEATTRLVRARERFVRWPWRLAQGD